MAQDCVLDIGLKEKGTCDSMIVIASGTGRDTIPSVL